MIKAQAAIGQGSEAIVEKGVNRSCIDEPVIGVVGASSPAKGEENQKPTQIGISISQKVSKRAVIRNRIKRWIRAALRQLWPRLESGWQLVIVVKSGMATECDYAEILQELEQLLAEAEVINGN